MKYSATNLVTALGLVVIGLALAAAGIYIGETDDAPGAALIGILLMIGAVALGVRTARREGTTVTIPLWWIVAALIVVPLLVFFVLAGPMNHDENVALSRNEVVQDSSGGRTWHGTMVNATNPFTAGVFREVAVTIRFLDGDGQPVGEISGRADQLEAGEGINLQAPLPPEAETMQVYSLQWRTGQSTVWGVWLGPWPSWEFGYLQYDPS